MAKKFYPLFNPISSGLVSLKFGAEQDIDLTLSKDIPVGVSRFGTLVMDNFVVPAKSYTNEFNNQVPYPFFQCNNALFEATNPKEIVVTKVQGREGSVKEYISRGDIRISITGQIIGSFNLYPTEEVDDLLQILNVPQQLPVKSKFINDVLGITHITILEWNLPTTAGKRNTQVFNIQAVSDVSTTIDEVTGKSKPTE